MRYHHTFQAPRSNSTSSFENDQRQPYTSSNGTAIPYHHHPPASPQYNGTHNPGSAPSSYPEGGGGNYSLSSSDEGHNYGENFPGNATTPQAFCPCRTNPATGVAYISLSQQLQSCLNSLRQFSHHPPNTPCLLYRRIAELNSLLQCVIIVLSYIPAAHLIFIQLTEVTTIPTLVRHHMTAAPLRMNF